VRGTNWINPVKVLLNVETALAALDPAVMT